MKLFENSKLKTLEKSGKFLVKTNFWEKPDS